MTTLFVFPSALTFPSVSATYKETCVVRCSLGDTGAGDRNVTEYTRDGNGHLQGSLECAEELAELSTIRMLAKCVLPSDDHFVQTDGNVSGTQVQTTAACSLWQKGRVEQPSRKWRTKRFCNTKWRVSVVSYEVAHALNPPATRVCGQQMKVSGELTEYGEVVPHPNAVDERDELARRFIIRAAREVLGRHASDAIRTDIWCSRL